MVTVSATERPQGERDESLPDHDAGRPELNLSDKTPQPPAGRGVAGRRHQTWASRFESGQGGDAGQQRPGVGHGAGWEVFSYLIAGMLAYGGLGWVIGHFTHIQLLFPVGMLVGLAISLGWIVYKYGRQK
jgi:F0F1-type ATP synthase assembly protein I